MTTVQMNDWDDGTVGFQSQRGTGAGELRDSIVVHPTRKPGARGVVVEFATELHYGGGTTQRSESSIALDPEQAATFARAMSAPRLGGIAGANEMRIALTGQIDNLADVVGRYVWRLVGVDEDEQRYAQGAIDHARKVAQPYNYNGDWQPPAPPKGHAQQMLDRHIEQETELVRLLPGAHYMDPPDGGDVSLVEQFRRMAEDARKWREQEPADLREAFNARTPVCFSGHLYTVEHFAITSNIVELTLKAAK